MRVFRLYPSPDHGQQRKYKIWRNSYCRYQFSRQCCMGEKIVRTSVSILRNWVWFVKCCCEAWQLVTRGSHIRRVQSTDSHIKCEHWPTPARRRVLAWSDKARCRVGASMPVTNGETLIRSGQKSIWLMSAAIPGVWSSIEAMAFDDALVAVTRLSLYRDINVDTCLLTLFSCFKRD